MYLFAEIFGNSYWAINSGKNNRVTFGLVLSANHRNMSKALRPYRMRRCDQWGQFIIVLVLESILVRAEKSRTAKQSWHWSPLLILFKWIKCSAPRTSISTLISVSSTRCLLLLFHFAFSYSPRILRLFRNYWVVLCASTTFLYQKPKLSPDYK